ncbi:hypothetical protein F9C07_2125690 [Aspergillus flavus]|uniref:Bul1 C-terminal domain-containing protein n=1 Tax=Aspergillus flavus (strain ATCC 200026 / FGSC A1120 / IAM 13836 / NRRL 3357 / JCM 12722 / SRRC 167) TaxID=332952 RepID=A0A7U2MCZ5_ASPFN|nr:uncharacterized protein G4B84_002367 [Aspergillus flavus NRRL3357]KAF7631516.1 hypothetical protein AFLA_012372 [Aspergillus flavus NRRL3357]KAJ1704949.1 hypothetical protein NYO67_12900 [Aspergillus flavus]QMW27078.1 hypothetical protein G4B84_002367 [Aspergillus flavus NRRL3357]QRD81426.1 hypothetical protein F9C07_2125690 [Aspergillus flavus]
MAKIPALLRLCAPHTGSSSSKVSVTIHIAGAGDKQPKVFTTSDKIEGVVTITVVEKTSFDDIKITLEGISKVMTWGGINGPPLVGARQTFMKLHYPIEKSTYQLPSILEPGWCYKFSFTFVVPENLTLTPCEGKTDDAGIKNAHTRLPPSMSKETDTECFSIKYIARVVILGPIYGKDKPTKRLVHAVRPVKILPSGSMGCPGDLSIKMLSSHKDIRIRHGWRGKCAGRLAVLASPTGPIRPPFCRTDAADHAKASIKVDLRYSPVGTEPPPRLRKVYSKLNLVTSFHTTPREQHPCFKENKSSNLPSGNHVQSLMLPKFDIASAQWAKVQSPSTSVSSPWQDYQANFNNEEATYTASIVVPISVPMHDDLVPSFHSRFISRMYTLELILSYCTANGPRRSAVKIEVPIEATS